MPEASKKVLIALLAVLLTLGLFVSCSDEKNPMVGIEVTEKTTVLFAGDDLKDFLIVKAVYKDGSKVEIKNYECLADSTPKGLATNNDIATVSFGGFSKTFAVNVLENSDENKKAYQLKIADFNKATFYNKKSTVTSIEFVYANLVSVELNAEDLVFGETADKIKGYLVGTKLYIVGDRIFLSDKEDKKPGAEEKKGMFNGFDSLESIKFENFDTSVVTKMESMFANCFSLENLDLKKFDTTNVTNMKSMFENCYSLEKVDLSSFNTEKVEEAEKMFANCVSLKTLDLTSFNNTKFKVEGKDNENKKGATEMFSNCIKLVHIYVENQTMWDANKVGTDAFTGCIKLTGGNVEYVNPTTPE